MLYMMEHGVYVYPCCGSVTVCQCV